MSGGLWPHPDESLSRHQADLETRLRAENERLRQAIAQAAVALSVQQMVTAERILNDALSEDRR